MRIYSGILCALGVLAATANMALAAVAPPTPPPAQDNNAYPDFGNHEVPNWATLPGGRKWGGISGIDIDRDGKSVWVFAIEAVVTDDAGNIYAGFTNVPNFRKFSKN
jgi:hypothetical protein